MNKLRHEPEESSTGPSEKGRVIKVVSVTISFGTLKKLWRKVKERWGL